MSKNAVLIRNSLDCFAEDFSKVDLHGETIKNAEFEECTFVSCDFSESTFRSCSFIDCRFENCNLSVMKLTDSKISGCEFISSKMIAIDWTMCDWKSFLLTEPMRFKQCLLNDSNFFGLTQDRIEMIECNAKDMDFRSGSFKNANFSKSDFKSALFGNTNLEYANFTDATNTNIDLKNNSIKGTIFNRFEALYLLESMGIVLV